MARQLPAVIFIMTIWLLACSASYRGFAQGRPEPRSEPHPHNYTVLEEHKDKEGNTVRTIQYEQGGQHIRETITIRTIPPNLHRPIDPDTLLKDSVMLVVVKSRYALEVWYRHKLVRSYKAVFGPRPLENKCMAGDRCTPEGWFTIQAKNPNSKYGKFMLLSYPDDSSMSRFMKLKDHGIIPKTAQPGGDVGIHGVWKGGDDMIEKGVCWTDGCVAITNKDVDELYKFVNVGTKVLIKK
jgi:L,D-transpeptidase catalytic domain